jgi:hypothetical protein
LDLLRLLSKIRRNDYDATADIIQNGSTDRILQNFKEKIADFGKSDCVVLVSGSMDYNVHPIYKSVNLLNETVKLASHTNVIICDVPYSVNEYSDEYNHYVKKFNMALHKKLNSAANLWRMHFDMDLQVNDYKASGNLLSWSGKWKQAQCINRVLKNVNECFYNSETFLDVRIMNTKT